MTQDRKSFAAWLQAAPMMLVFALFFLLPLLFVIIVSAWDYNEYEMVPALSLRGYTDTFEGCIADLPELCTILKTYLKTIELCVLTDAALYHSVLDIERDPHDRVDSTARPQRPGQQGPSGHGFDSPAA
jgi:ABC-type sugar transport system permease subunit